MAARKGGLGRGLEALLPVEPRERGFTTIGVDQIEASRQQPRESFDESALESLAESIRQVGLLQPVLVRATEREGRYLLVAGERRWRAARLAGLEEIPALVREGDEATGLTEGLIENLQREDLSPLEEAAAYRQLLEDFGLTHEEVGSRVGKRRSSVTNALRLLQLAPVIQGMLQRGELSAGHARALLGIEDASYAQHVAKRAAEEGWSVRRLEEAARARVTGEADAGGRKGRAGEARPAEVIELEQRLADRLGTRVRIDYGKRGGKLIIRFKSPADLERIYRAFYGAE
ncbi:MAG: ParB/RepB/Spo0J family partition protein [Acidimicrobiia bacterium]